MAQQRKPILDTAGRHMVAHAVTAAERHTSGEIVTILTDTSDSYDDVALAWSALVAFLALAVLGLAPEFYLGLIDRITGVWRAQWTARGVLELATMVAIVKFVAMWLLQLWPPLKYALVPRAVKHRRVRARAVAAFRIGAEKRTHGRTGMLIYLSMRERRAEIVADSAISAKVDDGAWHEAMAAMIAELKQGRTAHGMAAAVERVGAILAEHCPRADDDVNELPDRLIEI